MNQAEDNAAIKESVDASKSNGSVKELQTRELNVKEQITNEQHTDINK